MKYFDTDVLTNAAMEQNPVKYIQSNDLIERAVLDETFLISWLSIQELGFVLAKLKETPANITVSLNELINSRPLIYNAGSFQRAVKLADTIGFRNFND